MRGAAPIALFYFAWLGALGLFFPFFPIYLDALGFPAAEITQLQAIDRALSLATPLLFGLLADAFRARTHVLRLLGIAMALAFCGYFFAGRSFLALAGVTFVFALARSPSPAIANAIALAHVDRHGGSYGNLRLWGSIGFLVAVLGGGAIEDAFGLESILWATLGALLFAIACAFALPAPPHAIEPNALRSWRALLARPALSPFLLATVLSQCAHAAYDGCFSLHLHHLGKSGSFIGVAWAIGVLVEVLFLAGSARLMARLPAKWLFSLALATACLRWLLLAHVEHPALLLALQPLHGITFGCFYVAGVTIIAERAAPSAQAAAQGLFATACALGSALGMLGAGAIYGRAGATGLFHAAAGVAALSFLVSVLFATRSEREERREERERAAA